MRAPGAYGPYRHGNRWRLVRVDARGKSRPSRGYATREEAERAKRAFAAAIQEHDAPTVAAAIERLTKKNSAHRISCVRFFAGLEGALITDITPGDCKRAYQRMRTAISPRGTPYAIASQHASLKYAKWMYRRLVEEGAVRRSPVEGIKPPADEEPENRGKPQLRRDEALRWLEEAARLAWGGDRRALCCLVGLLCGTRLTETLRIKVRDVSRDGSWVHIEGTKNRRAVRDIENALPWFARLLADHVAGREPDEPLCGHMNKNIPGATLRTIAIRVDAPSSGLCFQSLRGMAETLARRGHGIPALVAAGIGHSLQVAEQHYVPAGADATARQQAMLTVLDGGVFQSATPVSQPHAEVTPATGEAGQNRTR